MLLKKNQDVNNHANTERQRLKLAQEFDRITPNELERLPEFDSRKYALIKRNAHFWLIPREYGGGKDDFKGEYSFGILMDSSQYHGDTTDYLGREIYSNTPCKKNPYINSFRWNGILISRYSLGILIKDKNGDMSLERPNLTDEQYLDICLTSLKILNEKIIRLTLNDFQNPNTESY